MEGVNDRLLRLFGGADPSLVLRFTAFHRKNPMVYRMFEQFSEQAKASGRSRFSHWMVANRIRWYAAFENGTPFKISNDYIGLYARLLMLKRPEFEGFFNIKKMKGVRRGGGRPSRATTTS